MVAIKRNVVLLDQSAAGNGDWVRLDTRYDQNTERGINISLTSGDTIEIEGVTLDAKDAVALAAIVESDDIGILGTYTESDADVLTGNWTYIRAVKTGTTGNAKIQGYV